MDTIRKLLTLLGGSLSGLFNLGQTQVAQPAMSATPTPEAIPQRILKVEDYQGLSQTPPPQLPQNIQDLIWELFPENATPSAVRAVAENMSSDPYATNKNTNGTTDYAYGQNSGTINEMLTKNPYAQMLKDIGVSKPEDLYGDLEKGLRTQKVIDAYKRAPRWTGDTHGHPLYSESYGWQNNGYNLFPEKPIEEVASNPAYFKLREFIDNQR